MEMSSQPRLHCPSLDRKVKKPLMEKRRRARINQCLTDLKNMLLQSYSTSQNQQRSSKLEKADILEMTVQFVRARMANSQSPAAAEQHQNSSNRRAFVDGYTECAQTALRYLPSPEHGSFMTHLTLALNDHFSNGVNSATTSPTLTLSIPHGLLNQPCQPTPPLTMSHFQFPPSMPIPHHMASSMISPVSASASDRDSPCESTSSASSSNSASGQSALDHADSSCLLTPVTPSFKNGKGNGEIWRPW